MTLKYHSSNANSNIRWQLWHFIVPFITGTSKRAKNILSKLLQFHNLMRPFYSAGALSDSPIINFKRIDSFRAKNPLQLTFFPSLLMPLSISQHQMQSVPSSFFFLPWRREKTPRIYIYISFPLLFRLHAFFNPPGLHSPVDLR